MQIRISRFSLAATALILLASAAGVVAQEPPAGLEVGQKAPDFRIPSTVAIPEGTGTVSVSAVTASGMSAVVAFFPKAFTGG